MTVAFLAALLFSTVVPGCSMRFAANGTLPGSAKTIYVEPFVNGTRVPGVNDEFTLHLKQEITSRDRLAIVDAPANADLILSGKVLYFGTRASTTSAISEPLAYTDVLSVSAELVDNKTGSVLWSTRAISDNVSVPVISPAIIPTTPQFLQQNMRGKDVVRLPDIQVAATQQATDKQQLMVQEARDIYTDMAWGL